MRVAVADDDALLRAVLAGVVSAEGYDVVEAASGEELLAILERDSTVAIALVDWTMRGISGVEVCRRARALTRARALHIVLLTGRASADDVAAGLAAGADAYLVKPGRPGELQALLAAGRARVELQDSRSAT